MAAIFVDNIQRMPRRNVAAAWLAIVHPGVVAPPAPGVLTLTGYAPQFIQSNAPDSWAIGKYHQVDSRTYMPRRNYAAYQVLANTSLSPQGFAPPQGNLQLVGLAPSISQATTIFWGQDTHQDYSPEVVFQPARRDTVNYLLSQPLGQAINIPTGTLTLTGLIPSFAISGSIAVPSGQLTLSGLVPTFTQTGSTQVDAPLGTLNLGGLVPQFLVQGDGTVFASFGQLTLTGFSPTITQALVPTYFSGPRYIIHRVRVRNFTVSSTSGPRFEPKAPEEQAYLTFDFSQDLTTGESLVGGPAVTYAVTTGGTDPNPTLIANGGAGFDSTITKAVIPVQGGIDGNDYLITVKVLTSTSGKVLSLAGILPVRTGTGV